MNSEGRIKRLEDNVLRLQAIIDGSEMQTREAVAYLLSLVTRFLHEKQLVDGSALRRYVTTFEGDASDVDDYMGDLVRQFRSMLDFQENHPKDFANAEAVAAAEA